MRTRFYKIVAGGFYVCGILEGVAQVIYWGRNLDFDSDISASLLDSGQHNLDLAPSNPMLSVSVVGRRFHAFGIKSYNHGVVCWGYGVERSTPPLNHVRLYEISVGEYLYSGVLSNASLLPEEWKILATVATCHCYRGCLCYFLGECCIFELNYTCSLQVKEREELLRPRKTVKFVLSRKRVGKFGLTWMCLKLGELKCSPMRNLREQLVDSRKNHRWERVVFRVFKGALKDGTVVVVKRSIMSSVL
ncbi:serine/threonine-protein kinase-like protein ACR4 [Forsythia ovata]|uniref:non-specific serine/threonine protein kinase n=1 Tax=Forsythia ovata TaxID=205694 RepID=A0ABD1RJS6_9LAMI